MSCHNNIFNKLSFLSEKRSLLHGEYYTLFGIFGTIYYIVPYFLCSSNSDVSPKTLALRIISCLLCFYLLIYHQIKIMISQRLLDKYNQKNNHQEILSNSDSTKFISKNVNSGFLPLYWYISLCFCLPLMSTYNLLDSYFDTTWIVNSSLSILTLVLLVDSISFIILELIGISAGYLLYSVITGNFNFNYEDVNYFLVIYAHLFSIAIGGFFLYQRRIMEKKLTESNLELEKLNITLDDKVKTRTDFLNKALQAKTEFLNNISHEIRTPLQGIFGLASSLSDHWNKFTNDEKENQIHIINESSDKLVSLVSNLLDVSKFEAGKMLFDFQINNLASTIRSTITELKPLFYDKHIDVSFSFNGDEDEFALSFDNLRISQVIRNYLSNAIKYSANNTNITITLGFADQYGNTCEKENASSILVKVKDNGIGVPENELKQIFFPFAQSSLTDRKSTGTGLGLALCAEIIQGHQGKIWAYNNQIEAGSTFCFTIPMQNSIDSPKVSIRDKVEKPIDTTNSKYLILFVDDEKACSTAGKVILECAGFRVDVADCGTAALKMLDEQKYDLILLDLMMPDIYGTEVLINVKSSKEHSHIPVILQSGGSDPSEISKAITLGAFGYILKPYNTNEIISKIKAALNIEKK